MHNAQCRMHKRGASMPILTTCVKSGVRPRQSHADTPARPEHPVGLRPPPLQGGELPVTTSKSHTTQAGYGSQSSGQKSAQLGHDETITDSVIVDSRTMATISRTHENTPRTLEKVPPESNENPAEVQQRNPPAHPKSLPHLPPDLAEIVSAWDALPSAVRVGIVAMVTATIGGRP